MFRLAKFINSVSGAPECIKLPVADETASFGSAMKLEGGCLVRASGDEYPSYVLCGRVIGGAAAAYAVTESMTFKTRLVTEAQAQPSVGDRLAITQNDTVTPSSNGKGILEAIDGEYAYVKFIK